MADITKVTLAKEKDTGIEYYYPSSSSDIIEHQVKDTEECTTVKRKLDELEDRVGDVNLQEVIDARVAISDGDTKVDLKTRIDTDYNVLNNKLKKKICCLRQDIIPDDFSGYVSAKFASGEFINESRMMIMFDIAKPYYGSSSGAGNGRSTLVLDLLYEKNDNDEYKIDVIEFGYVYINNNCEKDILLSIDGNKWSLYAQASTTYGTQKYLDMNIQVIIDNITDNSCSYILYDEDNIEIITSSISNSIAAKINCIPYGHLVYDTDGDIKHGNDTNPTAKAAASIGQGNTASGHASAAIGYGNIASGNYSIAAGEWNKASGYDSTASGYNNSAAGSYSVAMGVNNKTNAASSVAIGSNNTAEKSYSTTIGMSNSISATYSTAIGSSNTISTYYYNHILGYGNSISGMYDLALGYSNTISASWSHIIGNNNDIYGIHTIVLGGNNTTNNSCNSSSILGWYNNCTSEDSIVIGKFNNNSGQKSVTIGFGTTNNDPNSTTGRYTINMGNNNIVWGDYCTILGYNNVIASYYNMDYNDAVLIGRENWVNYFGGKSVIVGSYNKDRITYTEQDDDTNIPNYIALGYKNKIRLRDILIGNRNSSKDNEYSNNMLIGKNNVGNGLIVGKNNNTGSHQVGTVFGNNNTIGNDNIQPAYTCYIFGDDNTTGTSSDGFIVGNSNTTEGYAFGNNNSGSNFKIGHNNSGSGFYIGNNNNGYNGYAFGYSNSISVGATNSVAIGYNNALSSTRSYSIGYNNTIASSETYVMGANNTIKGVTNLTGNSIILGNNNKANSNNNACYDIWCLGYNNTFGFRDLITIGKDNTAKDYLYESLLIGFDNYVGKDTDNNDTFYNSYVLGKGNKAYSSESVLIGTSNVSGSITNTYTDRTENDGSILIGISNFNYGYYDYDEENIETRYGKDSIGIGHINRSAGNNSIAFGNRNNIFGTDSVGIGTSNTIYSSNTYTLGRENVIDKHSSYVIGYNNITSYPYAVSIGYGNKITDNFSMAFGYQNKVTAGQLDVFQSGRSTAIGFLNEIISDEAVAVGSFLKNNNVGCFVCGVSNKACNDGDINSRRTSMYGDTNGDAFVVGNGYLTNVNSSLSTGFESIAQNAFRVTTTGTVYANGNYNSSGADYAEFIKEWYDGNPDNEDRVGYMVTIGEDGKLHKANEGDYIIGITSGNPSIVGNSDEDYYWKFDKDRFNRIILENIDIEEPQLDSGGNQIIDNGGNPVFKTTTVTRRKISSNYDASKEYIERSKRPEWDYVGMRGIVPCRDDGTCVARGFCKCGTNGIATKAETRGFDTYYVIERIDEETISVEVR